MAMASIASFAGPHPSPQAAGSPASPPAGTKSQPRPHPGFEPIDAGLHVEADKKVSLVAPSHGQSAFGQTSALDTPRIEQVFTLKNDGKAPIALQRLQSSCGCTSAALLAADAASTAKAAATDNALPTLAPGQKVSVRVVVDLTALPPGSTRKYVLVFAKGQTLPVAMLEMSGTLLPSLTLTPALLDFGRLAAGETRALNLVVSYDPRLAPSGALPTLFSTNAAVRVTPLATAATTEKALPSSPGMKTQAYTVTLAHDAPLGPVLGSLAFQPAAVYFASDAPARANGPALPAAFTQVSAQLLGQVTGDVSAEPQAVAFGTAPLGRATSRQIVLTGVKPEALARVKVASASLWISARLLGNEPALGASSGKPAAVARVLEVTVGADAPAGVLQSEIKISLANGQYMLIPITAYVKAQDLR